VPALNILSGSNLPTPDLKTLMNSQLLLEGIDKADTWVGTLQQQIFLFLPLRLRASV